MDSTPPSSPTNQSESLLRVELASPVAQLGQDQQKLEHAPSSDPQPILSSSPAKRSRSRLDASDEPSPSRRRCKPNSTAAARGSPKKARGSRRRAAELEIREEGDLVLEEEVFEKPRKRRNSGRTMKEKPVPVPVPAVVRPPKLDETVGGDESNLKPDQLDLVDSRDESSPNLDQLDQIDGGDGSNLNLDQLDQIDGGELNLELIRQLLNDLIMWKDVAKSSLWFGFGSMCFISSCFANGMNFRILPGLSQLGLLYLGVSFFSNSYSQRGNNENPGEYRLKEEDILRVARFFLPVANLAILKARRVFCGEPSMTLKVAPLLLIGAEYGHLLTLWRLCAIGFLAGFSVPKLYSSHSTLINKQVESLKCWASEAWGGCSHKKIALASAVAAFWSLSSLKAHVFAAFIFLVTFRYYQQPPKAKVAKKGQEGSQIGQQQSLVLVEGGNP